MITMKKNLLFAFIAFMLVSASCKKTEDKVKKCTAGLGGGLEIVAYANHSGTNLDNFYTHLDTTFVKFNTTTSPGTQASDYDAYFLGEGGEDHIHVEGVK